MDTEAATTSETMEAEETTNAELTAEEAPKPKPKLHRGFAAMNKEKHRELARSGGIAAHAFGLAHSFTSEKAREAGKKGGAKTSTNREHMAAIGRMGGIAKGKRGRRPTDPTTDATTTDRNGEDKTS